MSLIKGFQNEVVEAKENRDENLTIKQKVNTFPLNPGGASFKTHKLVWVSSSKMVYQASVSAIIFCSLFIFLGFGLLVYNFFSAFKTEVFSFSEFSLISSIVGVVFSIVGCIFLFLIIRPRVFDKRINLYFKGFKPKSKQFKNSEKTYQLSSIIAIQIIGEHVNINDNPYKSFELNLVLEDASRHNVVDHGHLKTIIKDAQMLSDFLNIPIWHASSHIK